MVERVREPVPTMPGSRAGSIEALLRAQAPGVAALGGQLWRFGVTGRRRIGRAVLDGDWLRLTVSLPRSKAASDIDRVVRHLERNMTLPAGVRIARDHVACVDCMTAEIPIRALDRLPPGDRGAEIGDLIRNLSLALGPVRHRQGSAKNRADLPETLGAHLSELGWTCQPARPTQWTVELDVPAAYHPATLERCGDSVRVQARLCACDPQSAAGRATVWLAWQVASAFALVKPVLSGRALGFEVALRSMDADEVGDALGALSVAFRACAREVAALTGSTELAACYLRLQDISVP